VSSWGQPYDDSLYAALTTALAVPLVTADQRLSMAPGLGCVLERAGPA
jgi:predicted nucleic acid-binding protein